MGLETSLGEHIAGMVAMFRDVRRVLKPEGTLWLNYGDCYAAAPNGRSAADTKAVGNDDRTFRDKPFSTVGPISRLGVSGNKGHSSSDSVGRNYAGGVLKPKDLCMVPNRLAIALQEDGWWVRSEIVWGKPNPMPESIKDRPGTAHEKVFLLSKSSRYFYDYDAVKQPLARSSKQRLAQNVEQQAGSTRANGGVRADRPMKAVDGKQNGHGRRFEGFNDRYHDAEDGSRGLRNYEPALNEVWRIPIKGFREAHFATFPPELARRCILAGCPEGGTVLDPFAGAGTTGLVCQALNRNAVLIELNPEYAEITRRRLGLDTADWPEDLVALL